MSQNDSMLTRAANKLQKAEEGGLDAAEIERLSFLLSSARERMVCLRAAKRKHKFVPCWPRCENLIEDLKERGTQRKYERKYVFCSYRTSFHLFSFHHLLANSLTLDGLEQLYVFVVCFFCF